MALARSWKERKHIVGKGEGREIECREPKGGRRGEHSQPLFLGPRKTLRHFVVVHLDQVALLVT